VQSGGRDAAEALLTKALASSDSQFRSAAIGALATTGDPALAQWVVQQMSREGLRSTEMTQLGSGLMSRPETRDTGFEWLKQNAPALVERLGAGAVGGLASAPAAYCDAARAAEIEATFRPLVERHGRGSLALDRSVERVRNCAALKAQASGQIAAVLR
jgi:hypothetical protein